MPSIYKEWDAEVEECLGMEGDFEAVRWWTADEIYTDGERVGALTDLPSDIVIRSDLVERPNIVRHESEQHIRQAGNEIHLPNGSTQCEWPELSALMEVWAYRGTHTAKLRHRKWWRGLCWPSTSRRCYFMALHFPTRLPGVPADLGAHHCLREDARSLLPHLPSASRVLARLACLRR